MQIIKVALPVPLKQLFDYLPADTSSVLAPGMRVLVPFGRRKLIGIIWSIATTSNLQQEKLKSIITVLDNESLLNLDERQFCEWLSLYYHHPLGEVCATVLPNALRKISKSKTTKPKAIELTNNTPLQIPTIQLNADQQHAVQTICATQQKFQPFLLQGVTASGKTEVYLRVIDEILRNGQQALVLIPEIGLTPQTLDRFMQRFPGRCASFHSGLTDKQRLTVWQQAKAKNIDVVIGTRSAIFLPFTKLGIIIVDEEHDLSFKQQDGLRYSARDVAVMLAQAKRIPVVLASATPSLESLKNVAENRYQHLTLLQRAGTALLPQFKLIDLRQEYLEHGLSKALLTKIQSHLQQNNQVLLFLNRRGYAPVLLCHACGWIPKCQRCDIPFTFHQSKNSLLCHHCEKQLIKISACIHCKHPELAPIGMGTERIETVLKSHFPAVKILRVDRDSTRKKGQLPELLTEVQTGEPLILIGTQMLAKGHHFPNVTLVGIVNADQTFFSSDFRSMERMGQLITQVAGRAGRGEKAGEVIIQTHQPEHPLLRELLKDGYMSFAKTLLKQRGECRLPPFNYFALLRAQAHNLTQLEEYLLKLKRNLAVSKGAHLMGPVPAPMLKRAGKYHMQVLIMSSKRNELHYTLKQLSNYLTDNKLAKIRWSLDVDPQEMF